MTDKSKPVIEDVIISDEDLAECNAKLKTGNITRPKILREYYGGYCAVCGLPPVKKVSYDIDNAKLVEYYCSPCFERFKDELDSRLKNYDFA